MTIFLTIVFCLLVYLFVLSAVRCLRPIPLGGAIALSFASLISVETVALNVLSLFHLVNRTGIVVLHIVIVIGCIVCFGRYRENVLQLFGYRLLGMMKRTVPSQMIWLLIPLVAILTLTACIYPPNTYDSMTYHMARVAHWMQNASIDYYPTNIERQNVMGPGAEYLILVMQILSSTDYLANFIQFFAYIGLLLSLFYILRIYKIEKTLSIFIVTMSISAPMAIVQASGTQNDLVSSFMTISILIAAMRLFTGKIQGMKNGEYILLGLCLSAGFLTKPISLVVTAPFLIVGMTFQIGLFKVNPRLLKRSVGQLMILCAVITMVTGPDIIRKLSHPIVHPEAYPVYPLFSEWNGERFGNPISMLGQNTPFPNKTTALFRWFGYKGELITSGVFYPHEDVVGNPAQVLAIFVLALLTLLFAYVLSKNPQKYFPLFVLSLTPVISWYVFGLIIKNQPWISRLQLPLIFLLPFSFLYISRIAQSSRIFKKLLLVCTATVSVFSLTYGSYCAAHNQTRYIQPQSFWGSIRDRVEGYYKTNPIIAKHDFFLKAAIDHGCRRVGILIGSDTMDYPLTWRAMSQGISTRHVLPDGHDNGWHCMLYVGDGVAEHVPISKSGDRKPRWKSLGEYHTYTRILENTYEESIYEAALFNSNNLLIQVTPLRDVTINRKKNEIVITATGNDPGVLLPTIDFRKAVSVILRLEIESTGDTVVQIFYTTEKRPYYSEFYSIRKSIKKGANIVHVQLPASDIAGPIRLDPGSIPGVYSIRSMEFRLTAEKK